ncbi:ImpB MucB SamB family protein [Ligilactobacillus hayakitensis DSM 18933 = JCM 14209]|uniref:ImpB MucB SamB family protein n=2 Tax=Ligilactobacillus TaxID=2767887 RepID=A0A0R1WN01_9LACO|nr:ImpB MucB SamB family protein [Ligilactobacillus hayakitensis DSM 18933 = JCM 14209]
MAGEKMTTFDYSKEPHGVFFMIDSKSFYASVESVERGLNPLQSILVVMSEAKNTGGGLVLATSPKAKKLFNLKNVDRMRDLPQDPRLLVVPPRMNLYIEMNLKVNQIFSRFAAEEDILPYSIDESLVDMTKTWKMFGKTKEAVARKIQLAVKEELGIYTTVGIGENPTQAKLALDLFAKKSKDLIGMLDYQSFGAKIWPIEELAQIWGIGKRTANHLNRCGIQSMHDLAFSNPYQLKEEFGIIGTQLFATAWGIDRTQLNQRIQVKEKSIGNSQVLPRDYREYRDVSVVVDEIGRQVAARLRKRKMQTQVIRLSIGYSMTVQSEEKTHGWAHEIKVSPTDSPTEILANLKYMLQRYWTGLPVRHVGVSVGRVMKKSYVQLDLFHDPKQLEKENKLNQVMDKIRKRHGKTALYFGNSLEKGGTYVERQSLVGGHNGGNTLE